MGRPTKLDDLTSQRILEAVRLGTPWYLAARAGGVDPATLRNWKARARKGEAPYDAFFARLKKAEAEAVSSALGTIRLAADQGTWQAAAWFLERRFPRSFALRRDRLERPDQAEAVAEFERLGPEGKRDRLLEAKAKIEGALRRLVDEQQ